MPVLASVKRRDSGMAFDYAKHNFKPNVLPGTMVMRQISVL